MGIVWHLTCTILRHRPLLLATHNFTHPTPFTLHHYSSLPFFASPPLSQVDIIHTNAIKDGSAQTLLVSNYILNLYTKGYDFNSAQKLFDEISDRDVRSWTILISGFSRFGYYRKGLDYFIKMLNEGLIVPNQYTFASVFKCCANVNGSSVEKARVMDGLLGRVGPTLGSNVNDGLVVGKAIHCWILRNGIVIDATLENAILDHYVKCGVSEYAKRLFELMDGRSIVSWNIMMAANLSSGDMEKSVKFFRRMPLKDVSSWNSIIGGLLEHGFERIALEMLYEMVNFGPAFDEVTFSTSLALVSRVWNLELGRQIHGRALRVGMEEDAFVRTSLIDMYCKCGRMEAALSILPKWRQDTRTTRSSKIYYDDLIAEKISWSTMIAGYAQTGMVDEALRCFSSMITEKVELNEYVLTSILTATASAGILELGQQIHAHIFKFGHEQDVVLSSSMVDMYAKCGKLDEAWSFFEQAQTRNVVLWTAMISSYAAHGQGKEAIQLFELMQKEGIVPNEVSFVGVITACSHAGLVEEGCVYFKLMTEVYGIKPGVEHFTSMVDLFGRAGRLDEIKDFIHENNISDLSAVWKAFQSSCWLHKNFEMAKQVSKKLLEIDPSEDSPYILLSNACSANDIWDEAAKIRGLMQEKKVNKLPGQSWI